MKNRGGIWVFGFEQGGKGNGAEEGWRRGFLGGNIITANTLPL